MLRVLVAALGIGAVPAAARCRIERFPAMPVTMRAGQPATRVLINGKQATFIVSTGSLYSFLLSGDASHYDLRVTATSPDAGSSLVSTPDGFGVTQQTIVKSFTLLNIPLHNVRFLVADDKEAPGIAGTLGQGMLQVADDEFDFPDGLMRFDEAKGCSGDQFAYWSAGHPVSVVELEHSDRPYARLVGHVLVNGHRVRAIFETEANDTILSLTAARRAGITPQSPGVVPVVTANAVTGPKAWIAQVDVVQIGSEKIEHTRMLIEDLHASDPKGVILIGSDFFLAHRIYVSHSLAKLYFTYSGGRVFRYAHHTVAAGASTPAAVPPGSHLSAAALFRRGLALAAQGRFGLATAELKEACRLKPTDARYREHLGQIYQQRHQYALALQNYQAAARLKPDDPEARLEEVQLLIHQRRHGKTGARRVSRAVILADLREIDGRLPASSYWRFMLGHLYLRVHDYPAAIRQDDSWIRHHQGPHGLAWARDNRCWARADVGQSLAKALKDCDWALAYMGLAGKADVLGARALVDLRLGRWQAAVRDSGAGISAHQAAVRTFGVKFKRPKQLASLLFGRGLAQLHLGDSAQGEADIHAAEELRARISRDYLRLGLHP